MDLAAEDIVLGLGELGARVNRLDAAADRLAEVGAAYRAVMGKHYPAMTLVEVAALLEPQAKVEIETTAVV